MVLVLLAEAVRTHTCVSVLDFSCRGVLTTCAWRVDDVLGSVQTALAWRVECVAG